jgi:type II secretory pathway pseudopilin PulG
VIELLTVLGIMGIVMTSLTTIFVSGSKAEVDLNKRFQSQHNTRLALDRIRRDIHCASDATAYSQTFVTLKSSFCGDVSWCTAAVSGFTYRYALYRKSGLTCSSSTGTRVADYLTTGNVFTSFTHTTGALAALSVDFPTGLKATGRAKYELKDTIYMRNSTRS